MMKIYIYNENILGLAGSICSDDETIERYEADECGDISLWGDGSEEELITQALERLAKRTDKRPGGNLDSFAWRECRNVLELLGGPEVDYNDATGTYLPVVEEVEEA